jgi:hypothetical protein
VDRFNIDPRRSVPEKPGAERTNVEIRAFSPVSDG